MKKIKNLLLFTVILFLSCYIKDEYKRISIRSKKVTIEIPNSWKIDKAYPQFADYRRKFGIQYKADRDLCKITANVYDSLRLDSNKVTENLIQFYKDSKRKVYGESLFITESGLRKIDNQNIGLIRYTYSTKDESQHYGIHFFFRGEANEFYEIEIVGHKIDGKTFRPIADKIFDSIKFE